MSRVGPPARVDFAVRTLDSRRLAAHSRAALKHPAQSGAANTMRVYAVSYTADAAAARVTGNLP